MIWQIYILFDSNKNGTHRYDMDQVMGQTKCHAKNRNFVSFNCTMVVYYELSYQAESVGLVALDSVKGERAGTSPAQ